MIAAGSRMKNSLGPSSVAIRDIRKMIGGHGIGANSGFVAVHHQDWPGWM